jgi:hypothetical protein
MYLSLEVNSEKRKNEDNSNNRKQNNYAQINSLLRLNFVL